MYGQMRRYAEVPLNDGQFILSVLDAGCHFFVREASLEFIPNPVGGVH